MGKGKGGGGGEEAGRCKQEPLKRLATRLSKEVSRVSTSASLGCQPSPSHSAFRRLEATLLTR